MKRGAYRVGTTFNPSGNSDVDKIKAASAELIDMIDALRPDLVGVTTADASEVTRLKALAMTEVESAAMWAVKAATKRSMSDA